MTKICKIEKPLHTSAKHKYNMIDGDFFLTFQPKKTTCYEYSIFNICSLRYLNINMAWVRTMIDGVYRK